MIDRFTSSPRRGLVVWTALYVSDYVLTITCARMYQAGAQERFRFEGSSELTPYYQADVDALRMVSPRFLFMLLVSWLLQGSLWYLTTKEASALRAYQAGRWGARCWPRITGRWQRSTRRVLTRQCSSPLEVRPSSARREARCEHGNDPDTYSSISISRSSLAGASSG